jgi:hypothetical protein
VRHGDEGGGPDGAAQGVGDGEVVAGGAVGVAAQLQPHVNADEAPRGMELRPFVDAEEGVTCDV